MTLLDAKGRPVRRDVLTRDLAAGRLGSARSPLPGYPGDGLNPMTLTALLRSADAGDPVRYLELAEVIEERDPHYLAVLGTRRRSVTQIGITVEAGDDSAAAEADAETVRQWLKRGELDGELFSILDCVGKGYSFTEIIWEVSEGQWSPARLEWRDPRWFRFSRDDLSTPLRLGDHGEHLPLEPAKFIFAQMQAKSGLPVRGGLARPAAWVYLFKMLTLRDWAIFTQTFGQPVRLGKFRSGADEADKETLFRAVAQIAGDMAAIIPEDMAIEFVSAPNVGAAHTLYLERADWLDRQVSKLVLGQTATTDALTGGLGSGKEHREVQKDIETADARALASILNAQLVRPWLELNGGPRKVWPRLKIERPEQEDLAALSSALAPLVDRGLEVDAGDLRQRFNLPEPAPTARRLRPLGREVVGPEEAERPSGDGETGGAAAERGFKRVSGDFKRGQAPEGIRAALQAEGAPAGKSGGLAPAALLSARLAQDARPEVARLLSRIEDMVQAARSLDELRAILVSAADDIDTAELASLLALALVAAEAGGRIDALEEAGE